MVRFRYIIVIAVHKGDKKDDYDDDNNNNNNNNNNKATTVRKLITEMLTAAELAS
jgi:hypothetical protein